MYNIFEELIGHYQTTILRLISQFSLKQNLFFDCILFGDKDYLIDYSSWSLCLKLHIAFATAWYLQLLL